MSERDSYPHGVPCWVESVQADPAGARRFYSALLGWDFEGGDGYELARLRGRDVAGIASQSEAGTSVGWYTQVRVENLEESTAAARAAGGRIVAHPFAVPPAGRLAVIEDPSGATLCLWEAGVREGAQTINEPSSWAMSSLVTSDPEAAAAFYGAVFGWTSEAWGPMVLFRLPGYIGGTPEQPVPRDTVAVMIATEGSSAWHVDFRVDDADAVAERATTLGGSVLRPPSGDPATPLRSAMLSDAEGAAFSVSSIAA